MVHLIGIELLPRYLEEVLHNVDLDGQMFWMLNEMFRIGVLKKMKLF